MTLTKMCQHIICRKGQDRQDLQCQRQEHGKETKHLHTKELGFCGERYKTLQVNGRSGGHTNPLK